MESDTKDHIGKHTAFSLSLICTNSASYVRLTLMRAVVVHIVSGLRCGSQALDAVVRHRIHCAIHATKTDRDITGICAETGACYGHHGVALDRAAVREYPSHVQLIRESHSTVEKNKLSPHYNLADAKAL